MRPTAAAALPTSSLHAKASPCGHARLGLVGAQGAAGSRIERLAGRPVRRPRSVVDLGANLLARAETGIGEPVIPQFLQRLAVDGVAIGLTHRRPVPVETQPTQVVVNRLLEFGSAALLVDILDAKSKSTAGRSRRFPGEQRGIGVPQVKIARRARCEPSDAPPARNDRAAAEHRRRSTSCYRR